MENLNEQEINFSIAKERVRQLKKFYGSVAVFLLIIAIFSGRKFYKTGDFNFMEFNNWSVIFWIWGFFLAVKAVKLFLFNANWQKRMMDKQLKK